ncbi:hypothetical protein [Elizabethkingia meningoseptica]|uniref:hypothetical protein n=1 Tax=Elizabethkingia meningoseptica TaxID=238 RepID=UPI0038923D88
MKILKHFLIRLLITVIPLAGLYIYAGIAFRENKQKEHPTDVGLGIAFLLIFILSTLFICFIIDFIVRLLKKDYKVALTDIPFLLFFLIPVLYLNCLWSGGGAFCGWLTSLIDSIDSV